MRGRVALLAALACAALSAVAPTPALARPPALTARSAILVEASTGRVLFARQPNARRAIASTTKLMTVLLALEREPLGRVLVTPPYAASPAESQIGLAPGERLTVADLVRAALLPSANDAAQTLAVRVGGSLRHFVSLMNARARRLHLRRTHFDTPVGLDDPANFSTAHDLARLALALRRIPFARGTMDRPRAVLNSGAHRRVVVNRNDLVARVRWVNGVKTGHTLDAGYVLVGSGTRGAMTLVSVVLGTPSESARDSDTLALLRYGFAHFHLTAVVRPGAAVARVSVDGRPGQFVPLVASRGVRTVLGAGERPRVAVTAPAKVRGPLPARAVVGRAVVRRGGRVLARIPLLAGRAVPGPGFASTAGHVLATLGKVLVVVLVLAGLGAVALRRRARRRFASTA